MDKNLRTIIITISNANAIQTQVTNLVQGVYQFELKVTDAGGLFSKDTMHVTCDLLATCEQLNRPIVNMQLTPFGNLSIARAGMTAVAAENKIFYAGGYNASGLLSRVDICNVANNTWSIGELVFPEMILQQLLASIKCFLPGATPLRGCHQG